MMRNYLEIQGLVNDWVMSTSNAGPVGKMVEQVQMATTQRLWLFNNGHRVSVLPFPFVLPASVHKFLGTYARNVARASRLEMGKALADSSHLNEYGLEQKQLFLIETERKTLSRLTRIPNMGRDDVVFDPETGTAWQLEMNRRMQAGAIYTSVANGLFMNSPLARHLSKSGVKFTTLDPATSQINHLIGEFQRMGKDLGVPPDTTIYVWCNPSRGGKETDEEERMMASLVRTGQIKPRKSVRVVIADNPAWWHIRSDGRLYYEQEPLPVRWVWRRVNDKETDESRPDWLVAKAWSKGEIAMINPWITAVLDIKTLQALWAREDYLRELGLGSPAARWISQILPPNTKIFTEGDVEPVLESPTAYLIKLVTGSGGDGTFHGGMLWTQGEEGQRRFKEGVNLALKQKAILMGRVSIPDCELPVPTAEGIEVVPMAHGMDPLVTNTGHLGILIRAKLVDESSRKFGTFLNVGAKGLDPVPAGVAPYIILTN